MKRVILFIAGLKPGTCRLCLHRWHRHDPTCKRYKVGDGAVY